MMPRVLPFDPADPGLTPPIRTPRCVLADRVPPHSRASKMPVQNLGPLDKMSDKVCVV